MRKDRTVQQGLLERPDQLCHWRRLELPGTQGDGTLLLLHGAGVAGGLTWLPMVEHLQAWRTLLIPDLRGMGETRAPDGQERAFTLDEVVTDVEALLDVQGVECCDVIGYSFGGLVAMRLKQRLEKRIGKTGLLEPALLERGDREVMIQVREGYAEAAERIRWADSAKKGIVAFLDLIAPHRSKNPRVEHLMIKRLAHRPLGFANALDCVTDAVRHLDREALLAAQRDVISIVGERSLSAMKAYHAAIAQSRDDWRYHELPGTDHSLPFQKPRRIAATLQSEW
ncbi:hypothetical protein GCM10027040_20430 [Halomonas shantousis]